MLCNDFMVKFCNFHYNLNIFEKIESNIVLCVFFVFVLDSILKQPNIKRLFRNTDWGLNLHKFYHGFQIYDLEGVSLDTNYETGNL